MWLHCSKLEELSLRGSWQITDAAFNVHINTAVRELNLVGTFVNGAFVQQAPKLRVLHCDSCPYLNGRFAQSLAMQSNIIQRLWMNNAQLSVRDWLLLSAHLPQLESVSICDSTATDEVVYSFVTHCDLLLWLDAYGCVAVTKGVANELKQVHPTSKVKVLV